MALSLLHQTVNPVGSTFTPNLTLYGWFTLYWNHDNDLTIGFPTGLLTNGQEYIFDIIRVNGSTQAGVIDWDDFYIPQQVDNESITNALTPWDGTGGSGFVVPAMRHHFLLLNGVCCLESRNRILTY